MSYAKLALGLLLASACVADAQGPESAPQSVKGTTIAPHPLTSYAPVTDAVLRNPDPSDWLMMRGNYEGWGFSTPRPDQQGQCERPAAGLGARHGARHQ